MASYWESWSEEIGYRWNQIFEVVRPVVTQFTTRLSEQGRRTTIVPIPWDMPSIIVDIEPDGTTGTWSNVQLLISSEYTERAFSHYLIFGGSAWQDIEQPKKPSPRTRYWCHTNLEWETEHRLGPFTAEHISDLPKDISDRLNHSYRTILTWQFDTEKTNWVGEHIIMEKPISIP